MAAPHVCQWVNNLNSNSVDTEAFQEIVIGCFSLNHTSDVEKSSNSGLKHHCLSYIAVVLHRSSLSKLNHHQNANHPCSHILRFHFHFTYPCRINLDPEDLHCY